MRIYLFLKLITLTIIFGVLYAASIFQESYFGRTIVAMGTDTIIVIYALFLAYIILGYSRYTLPLKPLPFSLALYLIFELIAFNTIEKNPLIYSFFQTNSLKILLFLIFFGLARVEIPFKRKIQPFITSAGLVLTGYTGYLLISILPIDISSELAIIFLLYLAVLAATVVSGISENEFAVWLRNSRRFMLLSIIGFSAYYVFLRPLIVDRPGLTGLIEWLAVGTVFIKLSRDFKRTMKVDESELIEVHRHRISLKRDEWIEEFRKAQENFIEKGIKSHLIAVLSKPLYDMGWSEERVAEMISPIVSHKDRKVPAFSLNWERRIIE
ncbi:MAG TPA: hypothetical protein EYP30_02130, partial [Archaeoglobaceae archaeon]|nr:hypothetical protein [Archaeoglobaceae archaeon]